MQGAQVFVATVPDFGPARGQVAWRALAWALLGGAASDDAARRAQAVADAVGAGHLDATLQPHLCSLLDAPLPAEAANAYAAQDTAARERGAVDAIAALLRWRAQAGALLVVLEDLHWADAAASTMVARALAAARDLPVAWAVTTRPEADDFDAARRAHARDVPALTLDLGPLAPQASRELAGRLAGGGSAVVERCVERAAGNPLFLEQLLRAAGDVLRDALPGTIQALVQARLDRLAPAHKAALQAASVLGQQVDLGLWRSLLDGAEAPLQPLVDAGLLRHDGGDAQFAHALLRDGAYESLLKSRRRELHLKAASWFASRDAGMHAEHLAQGGSPLAAEAFLAAARAEAGRLRFDRALALVQRGEAIATESGQRQALAMLRGQALREMARNRDALEAFEAARDLAGDEASLARAWHEIADVHRHLSATDAAWAALDAAQPAAERSGDARWRAQLHYLRGNLCFARGDAAGCAREHGLALELATAAGDTLGQAQALSGLGDAHYAAGRMHSAREAFTRCLAACERAGALRFAVTNHVMLGWCHHWCGDVRDCLHELAVGGDAARALSHGNALVMADETLGMVLSWMGRHDEALAVNRRAIDGALASGQRRFEIASRVGLAMDLRAAGRIDEALAEAQRAWQVVQTIGAQAFGGPMALIEIARCTADPAERDALVQRSDTMLADGVVAHGHLWTRAAAIHLLLDVGRLDDALQQADALERYVAAEPFVWAMHHVRAARARVRHARGERGAALRAELAALHAEAVASGLGESEAALAALLAVV
jgi:tetratricopeptide (TPR) repeat protein